MDSKNVNHYKISPCLSCYINEKYLWYRNFPQEVHHRIQCDIDISERMYLSVHIPIEHVGATMFELLKENITLELVLALIDLGNIFQVHCNAIVLVISMIMISEGRPIKLFNDEFKEVWNFTSNKCHGRNELQEKLGT